MAEFKLDSKSGPIVAGAVILMVVLRLFTIGESDDPKLLEAIRAELRNDLGNQIGKAQSALADGDIEGAQEIAAMFGDENIRIYSASVSKPLLSFSSNAVAIVYLEYELPKGGRQSEYWRMTDSLIGGWQYRGRSSMVSYYLNFM